MLVTRTMDPSGKVLDAAEKPFGSNVRRLLFDDPRNRAHTKMRRCVRKSATLVSVNPEFSSLPPFANGRLSNRRTERSCCRTRLRGLRGEGWRLLRHFSQCQRWVAGL